MKARYIVAAFALMGLFTLLGGVAEAEQFAVTPHGDCTYMAVPQMDVERAFREPIDDPRTLAFISDLENADIPEQDAILARAVTAEPLDPQRDVANAVHRDCGDVDLEARATRATQALAARWNPAAAERLESTTRLAIATLELVERSNEPSFFGPGVTPKLRDATLAVFGTSLERLDREVATPARPPNPGVCDSKAEVEHPFTPTYPQSAIFGRTVGAVVVDVSLDAHGFVRSAILKDRSRLAERPGADDIVAASIVAAGVSTYVPAFAGCKPIGGSYDFRADFTGR